MADKPPSPYWAIRHPADSSAQKTIAQFHSETDAKLIPQEIAEYDDFQIEELSGSSDLIDTVDQSGLSDAELSLLSKIYPVNIE